MVVQSRDTTETEKQQRRRQHWCRSMGGGVIRRCSRRCSMLKQLAGATEHAPISPKEEATAIQLACQAFETEPRLSQRLQTQNPCQH